LVATSGSVGANGLRRTRFVAVLVVALAALLAAPSAGAALPAGYAPQAVDNPGAPVPTTMADRFGENFANAGDLTNDGKDDLIVGVPSAPDPGLGSVSGKVVFVNGATGAIIKTIAPPFEPTHLQSPTAFGTRVARLGDIGSCAPPITCSNVGLPDGTPDYVVSAPGADIASNAVDMGIVYVIDGKTFQVLKRIELPPFDTDRPATSPGFGGSLISPAGEPACAGFGGIGGCPSLPISVARGDVDADLKPDVVIGAPDYSETAESNPAGCSDFCRNLGRVYVYSGKDIAGPASVPLDTPITRVTWFDTATASQEPRLGAALAPVGDVGRCNSPPGQNPCPSASNSPDGHPDFLASAPGLDVEGSADAGKVLVLDGQSGSVIGTLPSPDPQPNAGFGSFTNLLPAPGDLAGSGLPDFYVPALGQDLSGGTDQGRGYLMSGDLASPALIARIDDPSPVTGGRFGVFAGLGDVGGDAKGDLALGRADAGGGSVQIFSVSGPTLLQTIPDAEPGAGFGAAIAPMGDLNGDGFLDLAVGAPGHAGGVGRVYLVRSGVSPAGGGGVGGPGPVPGGGASTSPAPTKPPSKRKTRRRVSTLMKRTLKLTASKNAVKVGGLVTFKGRLIAKRRSCRARQKVALQRLDQNNFYATINVGVTKRNGRFATSTRPAPAQTLFYRVRVSQTKKCMGANSKRVKVVAKN
jgi:FG-GAP repeat protein